MPTKVCLVSPLLPSSSGIAVWSDSVLTQSRDNAELQFVCVDTAVHWRAATNVALVWRLLGGTMQSLRDIFRVIKSIAETRPHVLHLCSSCSLATVRDIVILGLAKLWSIPSVLHIHMGRIPAIIREGRLEWHLLRRAMALASSVVVLDARSEIAIRDVLAAGKVQRIPNPIDLELVDRIRREAHCRSRKSDRIQITFVGHVIPSKGIDDLVRACCLLSGIDFELNLVGMVESEYRQSLLRMSIGSEDWEWLKFWDELPREDALRLMSDSDVVVLPSHTEGFPNVILEAMALAKPIVATDVGAISEMLAMDTDKPCGVMIPPRTPAELAEAIRNLIMDQAKANALGERARTRVVSCFSPHHVVSMYEGLWMSLAHHAGHQERSEGVHDTQRVEQPVTPEAL